MSEDEIRDIVSGTLRWIDDAKRDLSLAEGRLDQALIRLKCLEKMLNDEKNN